jgi:hypothetical protein
MSLSDYWGTNKVRGKIDPRNGLNANPNPVGSSTQWLNAKPQLIGIWDHELARKAHAADRYYVAHEIYLKNAVRHGRPSKWHIAHPN